MIDFCDVSVIYDQNVIALNHINCHLQDNQCHVIIGKNGSGKSTFLQSIVGLVELQGELIVGDKKVCQKNFEVIREKVGLVFQNPDHQLFMNTIYDDLAFGLINQGLSKEEIDRRIQDIAHLLQIEHLLQRSCHKLSGGQKRMIAIATVLVMQPDVILMDEPSSFLDPVSRRAIIRFIQSYHQTIVIATHDLDMALEVADEVVLLNEGQIIAQDRPSSLLINQQLLEDNGLELPYRYQR